MTPLSVLELFPNSQKYSKFRFLNVALVGLLNFFQFNERDGELGFFSISSGCTSKCFLIH